MSVRGGGARSDTRGSVIAKTDCHPTCAKHALYDVAGSKQAEFCMQHAQEEMFNVISKRSGHPTCTKQPLHGVEGGKKAEFCVQHAQEGMVNIVSKRCGHPTCTKLPSFSVAGGKKTEFCAGREWLTPATKGAGSQLASSYCYRSASKAPRRRSSALGMLRRELSTSSVRGAGIKGAARPRHMVP